MNDLKNLSIAGLPSVISVVLAVEMQTLITILSAIVLPVIFFVTGKGIDVWLQIRRDKESRKNLYKKKTDPLKYGEENRKEKADKDHEPPAKSTRTLKVRGDLSEDR